MPELCTPDLGTLLAEVAEGLSSLNANVSCSIGACPDLRATHGLPFPGPGQHVLYVPDTAVETDELDQNGRMHRLVLSKKSAVWTDGLSTDCLHVRLEPLGGVATSVAGVDWRSALNAVFDRVFSTQWAFLVLRIENDSRLAFHVLSAGKTAAAKAAAERKESRGDAGADLTAQLMLNGGGSRPGSVLSPLPPNEQSSDVRSMSIYVVPVSKILAAPKKKVVKKVVKSNGKNGSTATVPAVAAEMTATNGGSVQSAESKAVKKTEDEPTAELPPPHTNGHHHTNGEVTNGHSHTNGEVTNGHHKDGNEENGSNGLTNGNGCHSNGDSAKHTSEEGEKAASTSVNGGMSVAEIIASGYKAATNDSPSILAAPQDFGCPPLEKREPPPPPTPLELKPHQNGTSSLEDECGTSAAAAAGSSSRAGAERGSAAAHRRSSRRSSDRTPPLEPIYEEKGLKERKLSSANVHVSEVRCRGSTPPCTSSSNGGVVPTISTRLSSPHSSNGFTSLPVLVMQEFLANYFNFEQLGHLRAVHPHWDELAGQLLNAGYYHLLERADKLLMTLQRRVVDEPELATAVSTLTSIQVHVLNPIDILRAPIDEGIICFPYGRILDAAFKLIDRIELCVREQLSLKIDWESVAALSKKAQLHYRRVLEKVVEQRMGESLRLKAAQRIVRLDSFLIESNVSKLEKESAKAREDMRYEITLLQEQNAQLRKDNRQLKQDVARLESRMETFEAKFKMMARLLQ